MPVGLEETINCTDFRQYWYW